MIDWWVISSILAGLGTAYGANAYNKKDATELRKKAAELLAQSGQQEWATKVQTLQEQVAKTEEDKERAEQAAAQLQAAIEELRGNIQARRDETHKELQDITRPEERDFAFSPPSMFPRAVGILDAQLRGRGIVIGPALQDLLNRLASTLPGSRGTIAQLHGYATQAYEKDTAPKGGKGRRRRRGKRGGADTPEEAERKKTALAEVAPPVSALPESFLDDDETPPPPAPETPVPETPAPEVPAPAAESPPGPATPPPFPSLEEFRGLWAQAFAQLQMPAAPPMVPGGPPIMTPGVPPPAPLTKKDKEAQKAAQALTDKLTRAWDAAVKEVAPYKTQAETLSAEAKTAAEDAYVALTAVFSDIERFIPQLTQPEIRESVWPSLKEAGTALLNRLPVAVKAYKDAVGSLPSGFLSMFKTKQTEAAPTVSTTRHDAFVKETSDSIASVEGGSKELKALEKAIRYQIDTFFNPPEQFRGGCTLVAKEAKAALDAMEASKQQLAASTDALKAVKAEFKKYTDAAKGSLVADSVLPPVAPAPPPPPPPPAAPAPAPLTETTRASVKSRVEEIAEQVKARRAAEDAAERATPRPWNPMIPLPPGPPPEGGALWSSKPSKVVEESPELATLYTSVMTKRAELAPAVAAYTSAKALGQTVVQALQDMHSKEKAYLRLISPEDQAKERESCGYIAEEAPVPPPAPVLSAPFELPDTGTTMLANPLRPELPPELTPLADRVPDKDLVRSISSQLRPTTKGPTPGSWWHENADGVRKLVSAWFSTWKSLTMEEKKASKAEAESAAKALEQAAAPAAPPTGGAEDTLLDDIRSELKSLEGGVRKSTFKRRRKGKQNGGRVSRRRKDRSDRSHSHAR